MQLNTPSVPGIVSYVPPKGLKVIRPRHTLMLRDYMSGMSRAMIATTYGVSPQTVTNLVNDPAIAALLGAGVEHSLSDLDTLLPKAVNAIRDVLDSGSSREKLVAADKIFRARNLYGDSERGTITAEDVMQRVMKQFSGLTINTVGPTVVQVGKAET